MSKLQEIIEHVQKTWGFLPVRESTYALACFDHALQHTLPRRDQNAFGRVIAGFMVAGLRERKIKSDGHIALDDIVSILQDHITKGTSFYVYNGYFAHHVPDDQCEGSGSDYCQHLWGQTSAAYDNFDDAKDHASVSMFEDVIPSIPDEATNARIEIAIFDGDGLIPMGMWQWERLYGWMIWDDPKRN